MSPVKSILGAKVAPSSSHNPLATNDLRKLRESWVELLCQENQDGDLKVIFQGSRNMCSGMSDQ